MDRCVTSFCNEWSMKNSCSSKEVLDFYGWQQEYSTLHPQTTNLHYSKDLKRTKLLRKESTAVLQGVGTICARVSVILDLVNRYDGIYNMSMSNSPPGFLTFLIASIKG